MDELTWNLTSPTSYAAGEELECIVSFTVPEDGKYYLMGALYTANLEYIPGTLFGVLLPEGSTYAVNSLDYTSLWELEADEEKELLCKFIFNRSDAVLGLFLMKLADENPSLDDDQIGTLSVQLSSPAPPVTIESLLTMVMVVGVVGFMMYEVLKD